MKNPYISRGPIRNAELFYGRHHELQELSAFLQGNQSVSIVGPRKIGKTSLLYHLMRPTTWTQLGLNGNFLFVYLDCEVLANSTHDEIFGELAVGMINALEERQLPPEPALEKALETPSRLAFETAVRRLNQRNLRVVLMLDEFERLSTNPNLDVNFFNTLRAAAGRYQLIYLTASATPLIQLTYAVRSHEILSSPFFNIFAQHFLSLMPDEEARQLIQTPAQQNGKPLSQDIVEFLLKFAGGHPFCLQVACYQAYDTLEKIEEIRQRAMRVLDSHFEYIWRNLNELEQQVLANLPAILARLAQDTTQAHILRDLTHKCLLLRENGQFRFAYQALADYVGTLSNNNPLSSQKWKPDHADGAKIGPYEIQNLIARGGMAEVYKGIHSRLGRPVAIKVLPPQLAGEGDFRRRFEREAQAVAALKHTNIVQVFDFGEYNYTCYLVMEYVDGKDLTNYLREHPGPMPFSMAVSLLKEVASALDYAHAQGVVHRDVKPSNILLESRATATPKQFPFRAILTDFGIAKLITSKVSNTGTGMMGTLDYMAPEQIKSAKTVEHYADIYALGVLAYRLITGVLPFTGGHPGEVLQGHLHQPVPDAREVVPGLPPHVSFVLQQSMAKDPTQRFASAGGMVKALSE
ncbi:MAG: protein kinase [Anaerolineales bacterium]|nr:protein kinase [Anaerolineales bacterium]